MSTELDHFELGDPFRDWSSLSLLPQTLGSYSNVEGPVSEDQELEAVKSFFKSMVLKGSKEFVQQPQTIIRSYKDINGLYSEDGSFATNYKDRPQERRPALGRKRAKFSLNLVPSHSLPNVDISSSIDHIDDPEEYFSVFEQLEKVEKELKKYRGEVPTDPAQHDQSITARKRRPGLLGRTASYKHHVSANADTVETLVESQEPPYRRIPFSSKSSINTEQCNELYSEPIDEPGTSQAMKTNSGLQDATESEVSVAEKEKNVNDLLAKLFSSFKDFNGDDGKAILQESLQIKSIDVRKIRLPELGNIQSSQHTALKNRATCGELKGSLISPILVKSPAEAISTLQRRVSLRETLYDIYSVLPTADAPHSGDSSLSKSMGGQSLSSRNVDNHGKSGFLFDGASSPAVENGTRLGFEDEIYSPVVEADRSNGNKIISEEMLTKQPHNLLERNTDFNGVYNDKDDISVVLDGCLHEGNDMQLHPVISDQPNLGVEGPTLSGINYSRIREILEHPPQLVGKNAHWASSGADNDKDVSVGLDGGSQEEGNNMQWKPLITNKPVAGVEGLTSSSIKKTSVNCYSAGTNVETGLSGLDDTSQAEVNAIVHEKALDAGASKEATLLTDQNLEHICLLPEKNNEGHQTVSGASLREGKKQKGSPSTRNRKKPTLRRDSLADAGTVWEDGRRKSSRHRFRPLQHWRGERLLYGRIHDSLATVIGLKYASPGDSALKVKSYVSEEYADLVDQAAWH